MIGFVGTAAAHTNKSSAKCEGDTTTLTVDLTAYNPEKTNSVTITDGDTVLHDDKDFGPEYKDVFEVPGDVEHVFTIDVKAGDDPNGTEGWSFTQEYKIAACVEQTTPPSSETTTPPVETTTEAPVPTSSEAPPAPTTPPTTTTTEQEEVLAETGASVALPLGIAGVLIVGGVGAMFFVRRRNKA
ncbi:LPXTG cell wall anchor domain-containing protein [Actinophytocola sp. NPDC049390]|uniref:LPXTG cell wall anchor domain-containing protein n=1 Tax=Actinophytocola sp. NPDC049390 TaxID=3363894 RepID=UPI0037BC3313